MNTQSVVYNFLKTVRSAHWPQNAELLGIALTPAYEVYFRFANKKDMAESQIQTSFKEYDGYKRPNDLIFIYFDNLPSEGLARYLNTNGRFVIHITLNLYEHGIIDTFHVCTDQNDLAKALIEEPWNDYGYVYEVCAILDEEDPANSRIILPEEIQTGTSYTIQLPSKN